MTDLGLGSLTSALQKNIRSTPPDNVLESCDEADRLVVENILKVLQEYVPLASVARTTMNKKQNGYVFRVPFSLPIALSALQNIQAYNPARISEISIQKNDKQDVIVLDVLQEAARLQVSDIPVITQVRKRTRFMF